MRSAVDTQYYSRHQEWQAADREHKGLLSILVTVPTTVPATVPARRVMLLFMLEFKLRIDNVV